ncbi:homeobox protein ceh-31 [Plakobranchus ocellatus]|uniref:Homeobox protein ceh-31 n=1 Tax=Plakobranchus ocellatus TaxID=259542 RepID=A0AAV3YB75_9GAST|nr:homeobox protein ceh-31 [Plakobranchus ocellatus]
MEEIYGTTPSVLPMQQRLPETSRPQISGNSLHLLHMYRHSMPSLSQVEQAHFDPRLSVPLYHACDLGLGWKIDFLDHVTKQHLTWPYLEPQYLFCSQLMRNNPLVIPAQSHIDEILYAGHGVKGERQSPSESGESVFASALVSDVASSSLETENDDRDMESSGTGGEPCHCSPSTAMGILPSGYRASAMTEHSSLNRENPSIDQRWAASTARVENPLVGVSPDCSRRSIESNKMLQVTKSQPSPSLRDEDIKRHKQQPDHAALARFSSSNLEPSSSSIRELSESPINSNCSARRSETRTSSSAKHSLFPRSEILLSRRIKKSKISDVKKKPEKIFGKSILRLTVDFPPINNKQNHTCCHNQSNCTDPVLQADSVHLHACIQDIQFQFPMKIQTPPSPIGQETSNVECQAKISSCKNNRKKKHSGLGGRQNLRKKTSKKREVNAAACPGSRCLLAVAGVRQSEGSNRTRAVFSQAQLALLECQFSKHKYVTGQERHRLATVLGLTDAQIKTWYQNRRTKWKRQTAVGVDLLRDASNVQAVHLALDSRGTSRFWSIHHAQLADLIVRLDLARSDPSLETHAQNDGEKSEKVKDVNNSKFID